MIRKHINTDYWCTPACGYCKLAYRENQIKNRSELFFRISTFSLELLSNCSVFVGGGGCGFGAPGTMIGTSTFGTSITFVVLFSAVGLGEVLKLTLGVTGFDSTFSAGTTRNSGRFFIIDFLG